MTIATMKNLNAHIAAKYPDREIELVRGQGYFYFIEMTNINEIESIYVCYLNHMSFEQWVEHIEWKIDATTYEAIRPVVQTTIRMNF